MKTFLLSAVAVLSLSAGSVAFGKNDRQLSDGECWVELWAVGRAPELGHAAVGPTQQSRI